MPIPSRKPSDVLEGATFSNVQKFPHGLWIFHFGHAVHLSVEAPWRLLSPNSILVTREDDGQKFGLETPVDAEAKLRKILSSQRVTSVDLNSASSDLRIAFENGVVLEIVNFHLGGKELLGVECPILVHFLCKGGIPRSASQDVSEMKAAAA